MTVPLVVKVLFFKVCLEKFKTYTVLFSWLSLKKLYDSTQFKHLSYGNVLSEA